MRAVPRSQTAPDRERDVAKFKVADLAAGSGFAEMTKSGVSQTCYDLAVYSLVVTGDLKDSVFSVWRTEVPKANTLHVVNPLTDTRLTDPRAIPASSLIGFYRRFRKGERSALVAETNAGWVLYHMVRSMDIANSTDVVGGNNGERNGTTPTWSKNDITRMFDWNADIFQGAALPAAGTFGDGGVEQFVPFHTPVANAVLRLNRAFPGPAAFG